MNVPFVDLKLQYNSIKKEIDNAIKSVINKTAFIGGYFVKEFEEKFAAFCNVKHCIGVGNGTDAIYITLKCLGIGKGDEVITAANSFIATSEAITLSGAKVIFCDIDPTTYTINSNLIESKITKRTKAIIPVHLYGQPADMDNINEIAKKYNLHVIEDAAQAHGAQYHGKYVGALGHVSCFSFYPGKNLGAYGDGGAIVTNNDDLAIMIRMFKNHGRTDKYDHEFEGVNSRLDGMQAAILSVKLKHLQEWSKKRLQNARLYNKKLNVIDCIVLPPIPEGCIPVFHLYVIRTEFRNQLKQFLKLNGIETGIHYPIALPNLKAYRHLDHTKKDFPIATEYQDNILSLPMFPELNPSQIDYITDTIISFANQ